MKRIFFLLLASICLGRPAAQVNRILADHIKTLTVTADQKWNKAPVIHLNASNGGFIQIDFDDLTHEYKRYTYSIDFCNYDWSPNEDLSDIDYLKGFNSELVIDNYAQSLNMTQAYTHYSFRIPNKEVRLTAAGNYRVTVYDTTEDEATPVAQAFFSVVNPQVLLSADVSADTDIDRNATHQQMELSVNFGRLRVRNPHEELKIVVCQNYRWDNARLAPRANFVTPTELKWTHNKALIFDAGNEFRKFEVLNLHNPALGVDNIRWFDPYYHVTLQQDKPRKNYIYNEDQNGSFLIRNEDNTENATQSDYMYVHYSLQTEPIKDARIFVCGRWAPTFSPETEMKYNPSTGCYEAALFQKQGYYNYQYLALYGKDSPENGKTAPTEGNFYQTENRYDVFVYYRPQGGRYDQLVGYGEVKYGTGK